jgi:hypothetical protein
MHVNRMIRNIVIGLAALCLCIPAALAKPVSKNDRERAELHGLVQSVVTEQEVTVTEGDKTQVHKIGISEQDYDANGNLTDDKTNMGDMIRDRKPEHSDAKTTTFHSDMGDSTEHYKFDSAGNLIEKAITYGSDPNGAIDETHRYTYDRHGRMIEQDVFGNDGKVQSSIVYKRDAKGNIASQEMRKPDAKPPYPTLNYQYEFDKQGNWIKRTETVTDVAPEDAWQYSESQHGPLVRTITYYPPPPKPKKPHKKLKRLELP